MKESKIKEILSIKPHNGEHSTTYYFTVALENGDKGNIGRKSETGAKVGDLLKYEIDSSRGFVVLKEERLAFKGRGGFPSPKASNAAIALECATRIAVANVQATGTALGMNGELTKKVTGLADGLLAWLKENS